MDMRSYYTLLTLQDGTWYIQFGDYVRRVVNDELRDTRASYARGTKFRIINTLSDQASIVAAVAKLNKGE